MERPIQNFNQAFRSCIFHIWYSWSCAHSHSLHLKFVEKTKIGPVLTFLDGEFRPLMNRYLQSLESADVRSLAELIEYNNKHPELEFCTGRCLSP